MLSLLVYASAAQEISVMTYNIYWGGQDTEAVPDRSDEWLDVIISRNPDLVLIQEANGWLADEEDHLAHYVDQLNRAWPNDDPYSGFIGVADSDFHIACLTRLPVTAFQFYNEVIVNSGTVDLAHVFVHLTLNYMGVPLHVLGVHLKPGESNREIRRYEAEGLIAVLDMLPAGEMVIIGGDFNSYSPVDAADGSPTPPAYDLGAYPAETVGWEPAGYLLDRGLTDAFRSTNQFDLGYTKETLSFLPGTQPINRVDFLFHTQHPQWQLGSVEVVNDDLGHVGSDHYAVSACYRMSDYAALDDVVAPGVLEAWPNPGCGSLSILYNLSADGPASVNVLSVEGRIVRRLVNRHLQSGSHQLRWDGLDSRDLPLSRGTYYLQLRAQGREQVISCIRY